MLSPDMSRRVNILAIFAIVLMLVYMVVTVSASQVSVSADFGAAPNRGSS